MLILPRSGASTSGIRIPGVKPRGPVQLDRTHPLVNKLKAYFYVDHTGRWVDLARGGGPTRFANDAVLKRTAKGETMTYDGSTTSSHTGNDTVFHVSGEYIATAWGCTPASTSGSQMICAKDAVGARSWTCALNAHDAGGFSLTMFSDSTTYSSFYAPASTFSAGQECVMAGHISSTTAAEMWFNGLPVTCTKTPESTAGSLGIVTTSTYAYLGYRSYTGYYDRYSGDLHWYAFWVGRLFSDAEMQSLYRDPYQILIPAGQR